MFTKSRNWQRWSGPLSEVTAALHLAMLELEQRSGIPATVKIRISYSNQLTHSSEDPADLEHLHSTDLRRISDLWIDVELDSKWWLDQTNKYDRQRIYGDKAEEGDALLVKPPSLNYAAVTLRLSKSLTASAMFLAVQGPDRTSVEGLTSRLVEVLNRSTSGPTSLLSRLGWALVFPIATFAALIGSSAVRTFNLAPVDGRYEWQEIVVPITAALVAGSIAAAFVWALPSLELLDSMERSRFQRYRALLLTGFGTVVAGLIATAIWAAFT